MTDREIIENMLHDRGLDIYNEWRDATETAVSVAIDQPLGWTSSSGHPTFWFDDNGKLTKMGVTW